MTEFRLKNRLMPSYAEEMGMREPRPDFVLSSEHSRPRGGQHVGTDPMTLKLLDPETGIQIIFPPGGHTTRSQHKRREIMHSALEYMIQELEK
jgi:hypothetical protein